uniref:Uncharacterized protein n=1 Tax=Romanomermis culicivorax TaxID=13658 RepID=A0A915J5J3_ROMCU
MSITCMDIPRIICSAIIPLGVLDLTRLMFYTTQPLGVFFQVGCGYEFWICLLLTIFCLYIPGLIYAIYIIVTR